MTIKIEFPSGETRLAGLLGRALMEYAGHVAPMVGTVAADTAPADTGSNSALDQFLDAGETGGTLPDDDDARVDHKGVAFNPAYCGESADPFYKGGKTSGQWKKKRGVDEGDYEAWYADQLAVSTAPQYDDEPGDEPNTAGAFTAAPEPEPEVEAIPEDAGSFMVWCSERQANGTLSPEQLANAYAGLGLQIGDLFPPTTTNQIAANVRAVYAALCSE